MTLTDDLLARVEGALLDPYLTPNEVRARVASWRRLGVRRVLVFPGLLDALGGEPSEEMEVAGAVSFPAGGATLTNKRVELLECVRLGAKAATVVLSPGLVMAAEAPALEREMSALLSTAPELQVRFLVDLARLSDSAAAVFARVLKEVRPSHVVTAGGVYGPPCGPDRVSWFRARLTRDVRMAARASFAGAAEAAAYLDAGADLLCTDRPELLAGGGP
jgi:deoxyribose-phosphate aldolase